MNFRISPDFLSLVQINLVSIPKQFFHMIYEIGKHSNMLTTEQI